MVKVGSRNPGFLVYRRKHKQMHSAVVSEMVFFRTELLLL